MWQQLQVSSRYLRGPLPYVWCHIKCVEYVVKCNMVCLSVPGSSVECIPLNKIQYTTVVAFWAITDTWNVSLYIHIMDINTTGCIPRNKIQCIWSYSGYMEFIGHIQKHFIARSPLTYVTNCIQDFVKCLTFDLTTSFLVNYNHCLGLQHLM